MDSIENVIKKKFTVRLLIKKLFLSFLSYDSLLKLVFIFFLSSRKQLFISSLIEQYFLLEFPARYVVINTEIISLYLIHGRKLIEKNAKT